MTLVAPFPWFGGKRRVAPLVWARFGDVRNYIEPFAGSLAVLLGRPTAAKVETVNDLDAYLANFWRAAQADPEQVAHYADSPVNEADLHARHRWLVETGRERLAQLVSDPEFFDAKVAGWWVWGQSLWIGTGWCSKPEWKGRVNCVRNSRGIHANGSSLERTVDWAVRPDLSTAHGRGAVAQQSQASDLPKKRPRVSTGKGQGIGVHKLSLSQQIPQLSGDGSGSGRGVHRSTIGIYDYMAALSERLRRVRVCCGDWARIVGPAVTTCIGETGVFLDPPYHAPGTERSHVYAHDNDTIWNEVLAWAIANGDDPKLKIALCGYEGDHHIPDSWECVPWKANGGYGRSARGQANRERERIWFSPHCIRPENNQRGFFDAPSSAEPA
jgi:DNA adenine methylase